ncbi:hypothetical protein OPQ81_005592 [Rhizoctonia solani]|nr:hypothetical protein OPQ81_005592 [Rhizoctonia solani]
MQSPQVAVITGAAQGIGRAIALSEYYVVSLPSYGNNAPLGLASHGYSLAISDVPMKQESLKQVADECIEVQKAKSSDGLKTYFTSCDVSIESQVESLVETAVKELGGIDVMVANAGIYITAPLLETSDEMFDKLYAVNVKGVLYCYRAAAKAMIPRGGGRIIGASSVAGVTGHPNNGAYGCSKSSVRTLTQTTAREWGRYNITVNAYAPGAVDTDMLNKDVMGNIEEEARAAFKEKVDT